jgi:uncharacterized protein (TIGR00369 family)
MTERDEGTRDGGDEAIRIPRIEGYHCFACGTSNPAGLGMRFVGIGDEVRSEVTLDERFVGWENMAHGGIVSTMLDEVMAWTILFFKRSFCVTREIAVKFLKPVPIGVPLVVRGWIVAQDRRSFACNVAGEVVDGRGLVLASGEADFALLRKEQLLLLPAEIRASMSQFLAELERFTPTHEGD